MKIIKSSVFALTILLCAKLSSQENWPYKNNLYSYKTYFKDSLEIDIIFPKKIKILDVYKVGFKVSKDSKKPIGSAFGTFFYRKMKLHDSVSFPFVWFYFCKTKQK